MAVVIIGSIALVSGVFPKNQITPQDPNAPKFKPKIDDTTLQKRSIQLKTVKFEVCSETVAVEMVLDRSGSMRGQKIRDLKNTTRSFIDKLTDDSPIGLVTFGTGAIEAFRIQKYGEVKVNLDSIINGLEPDGSTYTRDAMEKAKAALEVGIPEFPGRQFSLVLVTDGVPNPPNTQNPVVTANEIKNMGVKIYVIGITQNIIGRDRTEMLSLMNQVASPDSFFEAPSTTELQTIFERIGAEMCQEAG